VTPYIVKGEVTSEHQNQSLPVPLSHDHPIRVSCPMSTARALRQCVDSRSGNGEVDSERLHVGLCGLDRLDLSTPLASRQGWKLAAEFSLVILGC